MIVHGIELAERDMSAARDWEKREAMSGRERLEGRSYRDGDVLRWKSNDAVVPPSVLRDYFLEIPAAQQASYDKETDEFLAEYRRNARPPSEEQLFEMRAAFGPGATVVDVITGQRIKL